METITKTTWKIDKAHSEIGFAVKHLMISNVKGLFKEFDVIVCTTENDFFTAEINFWLHLSSIDTGDAKRDKHLKSADFFDVEHYDKVLFKSSSIIKTDHVGGYELYGELTIKNITKKIKLNVKFNGIIKDALGNEKAGFAITGIINRKDWGLNWNTLLEAGGVLVSEDVAINCDIELMK